MHVDLAWALLESLGKGSSCYEHCNEFGQVVNTAEIHTYHESYHQKGSENHESDSHEPNAPLEHPACCAVKVLS